MHISKGQKEPPGNYLSPFLQKKLSQMGTFVGKVASSMSNILVAKKHLCHGLFRSIWETIDEHYLVFLS